MTTPSTEELTAQNAQLEAAINAAPAQLDQWRQQLAFNRGLITGRNETTTDTEPELEPEEDQT